MIKKVSESIQQKRKRRVSVVVESVQPLSEDLQLRLHQKLKQVFETDKVAVRFSLNPDLLGGMTIKMDSLLLDASVLGQLKQFKEEMEEYRPPSLDLSKLADVFKEKVASFVGKPVLTEVGDVLSVSDGVAKVSGLSTLMAGERVTFSSGAEGMALNLNPNTVDVALFKKANTIREGSHAYRTGSMNTVPVGLSLLGRVIDPLGNPLDDKESLRNLEHRPINVPAPGIIDRQKVHQPIQTGIKGIDALVPIGRGQRELIIGDRQTGKTTLIIDTIISQRAHNEKVVDFKDKIFCIYVAIGQKQSTVYEVMRTLQKNGAMDYTILVSAPASESATMQYLAPYAGCTIGEYFRDKGMHAIVFYDDLSKHAVAYREMSLLLKRPSGREAFPGDVFYLHSRLLERAAQMSEQKGGGSLTAIPVVETQEGDVSAYIPTNVISITDGQIFLESNLFHQGVRPAINVGLSVSRVGSSAQSPAMKKVSASLKLDLSQYREVLTFAQLSSDLDPATQALLNRGARLTEVMKQKPYHPLTLSQEIVSLYAGVNGFLDDIPLEKVSTYINGLLEKIRFQGLEILSAIEETRDLTEETESRLKAFIQSYTETFNNRSETLTGAEKAA